MKLFLHTSILLILLQILTGNKGYTQQSANAAITAQQPTRLFRVYWDDDYINYSGHGTDSGLYRWYTPGTFLHQEQTFPFYPRSRYAESGG